MDIRPFFLRTAKHKQYNYTPRYYDAEKEAFDKRIARAERELERENKLNNGLDPGPSGEIKFERKAKYQGNMIGSMGVLIVLVMAALFAYLLGYYLSGLGILSATYALFIAMRRRGKI